MENALHYAFIDESGTVGASTGSHFLVVAVLSAKRPRDIELPVRRALKKYGRSLSTGEFKAAKTEKAAILRMLQAIADQDVNIVAVIVDQNAIVHPPKDSEVIYRWAVTHAIYHLVKRFPRIEIHLDRRYTKEKLRHALERCIREGIEDLRQKLVLIYQESSQGRKEIQAADSIAWAFFQKYERGDSHFYDIIVPKVIAEELIVEKDWSDR